MVFVYYTTRVRVYSTTYAMPRCLGPSHPDTNVRCAAMMIRPYKPRDSGRSGSALHAKVTAVRGRRSGLAVFFFFSYRSKIRQSLPCVWSLTYLKKKYSSAGSPPYSEASARAGVFGL
jgi:hypothetical protein